MAFAMGGREKNNLPLVYSQFSRDDKAGLCHENQINIDNEEWAKGMAMKLPGCPWVSDLTSLDPGFLISTVRELH